MDDLRLPKRVSEYDHAHDQVKALRGRAAEYDCAHCGKPAHHWAYDHADPDVPLTAWHPYSLDPAHYLALCRSCHARFDAAHDKRRVALLLGGAE